LENFHGVNDILLNLTNDSPYLGYLDLDGCPELDCRDLYDIVFGCRQLHTLRLSHIRNSFPNALSTLAAMCGGTLTSLNLSHSRFEPSEDMNLTLRHLPQLKVLDLTGYEFGGPVEQVLSGVQLLCLQELNLMYLRVSDMTIGCIVRIAPSVRKMNVSCPPRGVSDMFTSWPRYTAAGVQIALENLPELRQLGIDLPVQNEWIVQFPRVRITRLSTKLG
jgi:hypothetical protein